MTTRRDFIKAAGASAMCSAAARCSMRRGAGVRWSTSARDGQRQANQDHRCARASPLPRGARSDGGRDSRVMPRVKGAKEHFIVIEERLKGMDAQAIDMEVLSINPFWYRKDRETAAKIVELQNEKLAELCALRPDRFAAFASLTLQYPDLAVQQLEAAVKKHGLRGAAIGGSVLSEDFRTEVSSGVGESGGAGGDAIHRSAKHAGACQALQGQRLAVEHDRQPARYDDCPAASDLRRNARSLPGPEDHRRARRRLSGSYAARGDHACFVAPQNCNPDIKLKKRPSDYLKQLYFDALYSRPKRSVTWWRRSAPARSSSAAITRFRGAASGRPYFATTTLSDEEKIAILGGNAARLFGMRG